MFAFLTSWARPRDPPAVAAPQIDRPKPRIPERVRNPVPVTADISRRRIVPQHRRIHRAVTPDLEPHGSFTNLFQKALNARYIPAPPSPPHPTPRLCQDKSRVTIAPSGPSRPPPNMDSSDDEDEEYTAPEIPGEILDQPAYEPLSNWEWTCDQPLWNTSLACHMQREATFTMSLMRGSIGTYDVNYISKSWLRATRSQWKGFHSELKLFSSPRYLRDLQGVIVPKLINIYESATAVTLAFEPPHESFWIEASSDMPDVLKLSVVNAYLMLHHRGILHGAPELRNMLINGHGCCQLINFHHARARSPLPAVGLLRADKRELDMELRQVMYKLNYHGARAREHAKVMRAEELEKRNIRRRQRFDPEEKPLLEDVSEPPPPLDVWKRSWINSLDEVPRRYIAPGLARDEGYRVIDSFRGTVQAIEEYVAEENASPWIGRHRSRSPEPSGSSEQRSQKRKERDDEGGSQPSKRARGEETARSSSPPPSYPRTTTSYNDSMSDTLLPAAATQNAKTQPDSVRDFAYEEYTGPRGYYFPYPPWEASRDTFRIIHIRNENAMVCSQQGLPYHRTDTRISHWPAFKRWVPHGTHISLGALKRKREEAENPRTLDQCRREKKRRIKEDRAAALAEDRPVRFSDNVVAHNPPTEADYARPPAAAARAQPGAADAAPPRSILKPTPPIKTVSYDLALWEKEIGISDDEIDAAAAASLLKRAAKQNAGRPPSPGPAEIDPSGSPGQTAHDRDAPEFGVGSSTGGRGTTTTHSDRAALSDGAGITPEDLAASSTSLVLSTESMLREDASSSSSSSSRDSRNMAHLEARENGGADHPSMSASDERDWHEEMEVRTILGVSPQEQRM